MNKSEALEIVKKDGLKISELDSIFKCDRDIVREALCNNGDAIKFIDDEKLLDDKELILIACKKSSSIEDWVDKISDRLKGDKEIALELLKSDTSNYLYISFELQKDKDFILEVINMYEHILDWIDVDGYKYFSCESILKYLPSSLLNDKEFMKKVISINARLVTYIGECLINDLEFKELYEKYNNYLDEKVYDDMDLELDNYY